MGKDGAVTHVVMVGGFLGAGKTTLLARAAWALAESGHRVGLVTNDQAAQLVDTSLLKGKGFSVGEVSAGCFCCRFDELIAAAERLEAEMAPDVLLCEPVGSCTDLVATVVQPLRAHYAGSYSVGPFSVLVDPARLIELFDHENARRFPETVTYILRKQLEEADLILLTKSDRYDAEILDRLRKELAEHVSGIPVYPMSTVTDEGVDEWLARAMETGGGERILDIDYDTYAAGEAALGWLNGMFELTATRRIDWVDACQTLLCGLRDALAARGAAIAHIKLLLTGAGCSMAGNLTESSGEPVIHGTMTDSVRSAHLNLNARVAIDPDSLKQAVEDCVARLTMAGLSSTVVHVESLAPGRPAPKHRFTSPQG